MKQFKINTGKFMQNFGQKIKRSGKNFNNEINVDLKRAQVTKNRELLPHLTVQIYTCGIFSASNQTLTVATIMCNHASGDVNGGAQSTVNNTRANDRDRADASASTQLNSSRRKFTVDIDLRRIAMFERRRSRAGGPDLCLTTTPCCISTDEHAPPKFIMTMCLIKIL